MISIHITQHPFHDYLAALYLRPLNAYFNDNGTPSRILSNLSVPSGDTVVADTELLTPENISLLRNNGCKIVGFNMIDSCFLSPTLVSPSNVDLIFSLSGIQKTNVGTELLIDKEFNPVLEERQFLPDEQWQVFNQMRVEGRLLSLPYAHWDRQPPAPPWTAYTNRRKKVLIRGGAHFRRVVLALFLLQKKLSDETSGFLLKDYFSPAMAPQFRFCQTCRNHFQRGNRFPYASPVKRPADCTSPATWGDDLNLEHPGNWNNRCPQSFFWLAEKFQQRYGPLDANAVETLFNVNRYGQTAHLGILAQVMFTADLKWLHTIYIAQRFWEGAASGAINLLPARTSDQEYFPEILSGNHFITFEEDFSDLETVTAISREQYEHIASSALAAYNHWIRPDKYILNTNLLKHIADRILAL